MLSNPLYAGAYVYGRRPIKVVIKEGQTIKRQRSVQEPENAGVFITDHHEAYIDWSAYQRHRDTMRGNGGNFVQDDAALAVRSGHGLLTGLLRCARCGHKLHIRYWGKHGTAARYLCSGDFDTGGSYCLGFGGATVDRRLSEVIAECDLAAGCPSKPRRHRAITGRRQRQALGTRAAAAAGALRSRARVCAIRPSGAWQSPGV